MQSNPASHVNGGSGNAPLKVDNKSKSSAFSMQLLSSSICLCRLRALALLSSSESSKRKNTNKIRILETLNCSGLIKKNRIRQQMPPTYQLGMNIQRSMRKSSCRW